MPSYVNGREMQKKVFAAAALVHSIHGETAMHGHCLEHGCHEDVTYVLCYLMPQLNVSFDKLPMLASWNARFCSQHVQRAAQARSAAVVHQVTECEKAIDVLRSFAAAVRERQKEADRAIDTLEMDMAGRISRQLGPAGDMYVVGAPYPLSKRTSLYADVDYARYSDALANSPAALAGGSQLGLSSTRTSRTGFSVGVNHAF